MRKRCGCYADRRCCLPLDVPGSAEAVPLPDASVDAVLADHAMHWFDMDIAGPELARVLVPGGILAGLWNVMDDRLFWHRASLTDEFRRGGYRS